MAIDTSAIEDKWQDSHTKKAADKFTGYTDEKGSYHEGVSEGWTSDGWGTPEYPPTPGEDISQGVNELGDTLGNTEDNIAEGLGNTITSVHGMFTDGSQYIEVADAASAAAMDYVHKKIERIKTLWNTPCQVTVKSLLNEVAPYASSIFPGEHSDGMLKALGDKIDDLFRYLLDVGEGDGWADLASDLGKNALASVLSDEAVSDSISDLDAVQAFASTIDTILDAIDGLQKILKVLEPIMPLAEIIADFAVTFWSGGTSAAKATNETAQLVEVLIQRLTSESMKIFRKYIYNIKITVPQLLVDAGNSISIADEYSFTTGDPGADEWLNAMFSDEWNKNNVGNLHRLGNSASSALTDARNAAKDVGDLNFSTNPKMKDAFMKSLVKNFMRGAIADARKNRGVRDYSPSAWTSLNKMTSFNTSMEGFIKKYKKSLKKSDLDIMLESSNVMRLSDFDENTIRTLSFEVL